MSAVFCSDSDDLNVGDQVICLKNGHWKVIPVKHWDKLSNTGTVYTYITQAWLEFPIPHEIVFLEE